MIKNTQFDSMIEVFHDDGTGSGQVDPSKLNALFDWRKGEKHPDSVLIAKLSLLLSFDVYSLRLNLRNLGIEVDNIANLRLSEAKREELNRYMVGLPRERIVAEAIEADLDEIVKSIRNRFKEFDKHTASMWENLSAEKFRKVKNLIENNHATIGGFLCGAQIKLDGFQTQCLKAKMTNRQLNDYVLTYVQPGLDRIKNIDHAAHHANQPEFGNAAKDHQ